MALQKEVITVPLGKLGMDSEDNPQIHQGLIAVKNGLYKRTGMIEKRTGDETLASAINENKITTFNDLPMLYDEYGKIVASDHIVTLNEQAGFIDVDVRGVAHERRDLFYYCDIAEAGDIYAVAYTTRDPDSASEYSTYIETFDKETHTRLDGYCIEYQRVDPKMCKVLDINDNIISYYYFRAADRKLVNGTINTTTGAIGTPSYVSGILISASAPDVWDACVVPNTSQNTPYACIAYRDTANAYVSVLCFALGDSTVDYTHNLNFAGGSMLSCGICAHGDTSFCVVSAELVGGTTTQIYAHTGYYYGPGRITSAQVDTYAENPGNTTLEISCVADDDDRCHIFINRVRTSSSIPSIRKNIFYDAGGGSGAAAYGGTAVEFKYRAQMASKPFYDGNRIVVPTYTRAWGYSDSALYHFFWINGTTANVIGKSLLGVFRKDPSYNLYMLPNTPETSEGVFSTVGTKIIVDDNTYDNRDIYQIMRLDARAETGALSANATERYTFLANSCPYLVDGNSLVEQGFLLYPEPFSCQAATYGVGGMAVGTYYYKLVYEWTDAHGQLHESSPSPDYCEVTLVGANNYVIITAPTLHFTRKEEIQVAIYRTTVGGGSTYYRVGSTPMTTNSDFTIYNDFNPDSTITGLKTLYTDSGEVENIQPKAHRVATIWQRRHFHVDREHEDSWIYYSKEFIEGWGPRDTDLFVLECDPAGGRIIALATLVDKLIIFKSDRIYASEGKGLDDTGGGYNFYTPYLVNPSVGCIDQRSIVRVPAGLLFQSADGIWLLDLSLKCTPVGQPVQEFLTGHTVIGTGKDNDRHLVQFFTDGYDMAYDWLRNKWSIWGDREALAATSVDDEAYWITADGYLNKDKKSTYGKAQSPTHYPFRLDTGWFSFSGVGGYGRVYKILLLAQNVGNHELDIKIGYDYDPVWHDVQTYDSSQLTTFEASKYFGPAGDSSYDNQAYVIKIIPSRQKCTAIRLSIEDKAQETPNAAFGVSAVAFEVGKKTGIKRTETNRTV